MKLLSDLARSSKPFLNFLVGGFNGRVFQARTLRFELSKIAPQYGGLAGIMEIANLKIMMIASQLLGWLFQNYDWEMLVWRLEYIRIDRIKVKIRNTLT